MAQIDSNETAFRIYFDLALALPGGDLDKR
jgi:hypothetical protein